MAGRVPDVPGQVRDRPTGWVGVLFAGIWLAFLATTVQRAWAIRDTPMGWIALAALAGFVGCYLWVFARIRTLRWQPGAAAPRLGLVLLAVMVVLAGLVIWTLGQEGTSTLVFLVATAMQVLPLRAGLALVVVSAVGNDVAGRSVPGWQPDPSLTMAIAAAGIAMWGVQQMIARNRDLVLAREENARLAVEEERNRFARDLHDILGHSLTVIAVKAELAGRLFDADPPRARAEIGELERLSRDALADVRQAVSGYRQPSLSGEIARARAALASAGIEADLPNSTDAVPSHLRELFAWTIREGVTNVIRHSGAEHCRVRLSASAVEVSDDGRGAGDPGGGHGLVGLRERASGAEATVVTERLHPGFALRVVARG
ncbi:sensor histidine kinase [Propionicimonas sp.]|uniref:sensor histidine kinase n=1 Tax=Propionicimonas sp. TaxID=1955623 RepID=UPI0039E51861